MAKGDCISRTMAAAAMLADSDTGRFTTVAARTIEAMTADRTVATASPVSNV